jgi:hypothetical protein
MARENKFKLFVSWWQGSKRERRGQGNNIPFTVTPPIT